MLLGPGYCSNGYYAGHKADEAVDVQTCAKICKEDYNCMFFALQVGKSCSRYNTNAGVCDINGGRGKGTHVAYAKLSEDNVAMRGIVSLNLANHEKSGQKVLSGINSVDELSLDELTQLEGYIAPVSE